MLPLGYNQTRRRAGDETSREDHAESCTMQSSNVEIDRFVGEGYHFEEIEERTSLIVHIIS